MGEWEPFVTAAVSLEGGPWGGALSPPHSPPGTESSVSAGLGERVYMCVRECTCEMWRRRPRQSVRSAKILHNQHIAHTSAASREGAGRSRGLFSAGWQGRAPQGKGGEAFQRSFSVIFPLN